MSGGTTPDPMLRCGGIVHVFDLAASLLCQCGSQTWQGEIPGSRPTPPKLRLVEPEQEP